MITEEQIQERADKLGGEFGTAYLNPYLDPRSSQWEYLIKAIAKLQLRVEELEARPTHVEHMVVSTDVDIYPSGRDGPGINIAGL